MAKTKHYKRGIAVLFGIIVITAISLNRLKSQDTMEYKMNTDLICVRQDWKGNILINGKFQNDTVPVSAPFLEVIKWKLSRNPQKKEKKAENYSLPIEYVDRFSDKNNRIVWLGHATFFIELDGVRIITDPILGHIPTVKRKGVLPCNADSLTDIDYLLISHDHNDHFNKQSIEQLSRNNPSLQALIPLNAKRLFNSKQLKSIPVQEAGWYQEYKTDNNVRIIFLPAIHWGRRSLNDFNKTLWGSFLLIGEHTTVFFAGDTAYGAIFKEVHELFGDIDICILPIGAYAPAFLMASSHMNPEEAVKAFDDLGGKVFIPMHYGTFDLSDEPLGEPIKRLRLSAQEHKITSRIRELALGENFLINRKADSSNKKYIHD